MMQLTVSTLSLYDEHDSNYFKMETDTNDVIIFLTMINI